MFRYEFDWEVIFLENDENLTASATVAFSFGFFGLELALLPLLSLRSVSSKWNSLGFLSKCWFIIRIYCQNPLFDCFLNDEELAEIYTIRFWSMFVPLLFHRWFGNGIHRILFKELIFSTLGRKFLSITLIGQKFTLSSCVPAIFGWFLNWEVQ